MAVVSEITLSMINRRFDAEYYQPVYLESAKHLSKFEQKKLSRISKVNGGKRLPLGHSLMSSGIPYVRVVDIEDGFVHFAKVAYIDESTWRLIKRYDIQLDDVLITIVGNTVGLTGILKSDMGTANFTENCARIRNCICGSNFILAFLLSKYGQIQVEREKVGTAQPKLSLDRLRSFVIPIFQSETIAQISSKVDLASRYLSLSEQFNNKAQQFLKSELGLDRLHFDKPVYYTAQFSNLELARRFDSEHFYPEFDHLKKRLQKKIRFVPLGSVLNFCQRGKQPIYSEKGLPVLNSKHVLENKITLEGNRKAKRSVIEALQIQYGDVLINGTGRGTIGRTAPYLVSEHQSIPDNHVTILRSPSLDPAYLSFYLNSLAGKLQVEKHQRGSSGQLELYPFDIRKIWVWVAPQSIQQEIRRLYDEATKNAIQAKQLLEQAKSRVEQLIEEAVQA